MPECADTRRSQVSSKIPREGLRPALISNLLNPNSFDDPFGLGPREVAGHHCGRANWRTDHRSHNHLAIKEDCHRLPDVVPDRGAHFLGPGCLELYVHGVFRRSLTLNHLGRCDIAVVNDNSFVR